MSGGSRAEEELLASEARYRTLFEYAPNGLLIANAESYYLDANASMCRMLGYAREELIGKHASDIVVADEIPDIAPALRAINSASEYRQEWHFRRRDGSVFPGDVIATVMPDGNLLAVIRDITERKQAELRVEHLTRVYAMLSGINETIVREKDPQTMLGAACRIAVDRGRFLMAWIALLDPGGQPVITAHAGATADTLTIVTMLLDAGEEGCGFTRHALRTGQHGVCNDIARDPRAALWRDAALRLGYGSMASLPLTVRGDVIGTLNLYASAPDFFDTEEMQPLSDLAMDIAFALELHERESERQRIDRALRDSEARLKDSMAELHAVSTRLNEAREQERVKMARDIHDHLGQALTALKMDVVEIHRRLRSGETALVEERLAEMSALIDTSVDDVRRVAAELRPVVLDDLGFIAAIKAYFIDVERRGHIRCVLSTTLSDLKIPDDRATALFRILQEALTNVVRHAEAQRVDVGLTADAGSVRLIVHDDGRGIPAAEALNPRALGLVGMRDRALLFGGDVIVAGLPGAGTTITVTLPLAGLSA